MYLLLLVLCLLGRFKCMALPLFSLLGLFFQLSITVTVSHRPTQHHLSWSPLVFFLVIFTLITVLSSESPVSMCLIHFLCIFLLCVLGLFLLQSLPAFYLLYVLSNWFSPFFSMSTFQRSPVYPPFPWSMSLWSIQHHFISELCISRFFRCIDTLGHFNIVPRSSADIK